MTITHGSLRLETITPADLGLILNWRNAERVNRYLVNREPISQEAQQKWFESLDPATSIFFMIRSEGQSAGLAYAHNISEKEFEGSIFIGVPAFENSFIPVKAALMLTVFFFKQLEFVASYSTVHVDNFKALDLDRKLGYCEISRQLPFIKSKCTREDFFAKSDLLIKALFRQEKSKVTFDESDKKYSFLQQHLPVGDMKDE
jgi:RimJ/RimL family protein N-acetyltransferase